MDVGKGGDNTYAKRTGLRGNYWGIKTLVSRIVERASVGGRRGRYRVMIRRGELFQES